MAKARSRKKKQHSDKQIKSVFLYGIPNKEKCCNLVSIQKKYTDLSNYYIGEISNITNLIVPVIKNDKKSPEVRAKEKELRPKGVNSAFSQNAFDNAVTHLSNRLDAIRIEILNDEKLLSKGVRFYAQSKVLFAMCLEGLNKNDIETEFRKIADGVKKNRSFYLSIADELHNKSDKEFIFDITCLCDAYEMYSLEYSIPVLNNEQVSLDSRLMKIEQSKTVKTAFVIAISDPLHKNHRIEVPINTTKNSVRRLKQYNAAGSVSYTITKSGKLRVQWAVKKTANDNPVKNTVGVDTGINDCFHTSDGSAIGSMHDVISFYHDMVEPSFAGLSDMRNKKKKILYYLHHAHDLPDDVRRSLIEKADQLEKQIRSTNAPYRKKRHYNQMLEHEISRSVKTYISSITPDTLTVIEQLDIKEFKKSSKLNGALSVFARGRLQEKLMEALQWKGYPFEEVPPEYTSQVCPVCSYLGKENRNGKTFHCICCGFTDDADHVGAVNIRMRSVDPEINKICTDNEYQPVARAKNLILYYSEKHKAWADANKRKDEAAETLQKAV